MKIAKGIKIIVNQNAGIYEKKLAIEVAGLIGFHSVSLEFPVTAFEDDENKSEYIYFAFGKIKEISLPVKKAKNFWIFIEKNIYWIKVKNLTGSEEAFKFISANFDKLAGCEKRDYESIDFHDFQSSTKAPHRMNPLYYTKKKGLEYLFEKDFLLEDNNLDGIPDKFNGSIMINTWDIFTVRSACELSARFGLEMNAAPYPVVLMDKGLSQNIIEFTSKGQCSINMEDSIDAVSIKIDGSGEELLDFITDVCMKYPLADDEKHIVDCVNEIRDSFAMKNLDGQISYLEAYKDMIGKNTTAYFSPDVEKYYEKLSELYEDVEFKKYIDFEKAYEKEFDIPWEVDKARDILVKRLIPKIHKDDKVEIYGALSEDMHVRCQLEEFIRKLIEKEGAELVKTEIICAYKQGFSWLEEIVAPKLKDMQIEYMNVYFKPFMKPGETDWGDVDGASPSYKTDSDSGKWFDLPLRYLQELYPVDDIISKEIGINRDDIRMELYEGSEDITYLVEAFSKSGEKVFSDTYKASWFERPYLDIFPEMGQVHPSTGYIKAVVNGNTVIDERIETDLESIWDVYQKDVLKYCKDMIDKKCSGLPQEEMQPFFAQMRMDIGLSEPERDLGIREDLFSPLNALHEDLYFAGLDFFKTYGMSTSGANLEAPGLIFPVIKKKKGKPYFKLTHYKSYSNSPFIDFDGRRIESIIDKDSITVFVDKIYKSGRGIGLSFKAEAEKTIDSIAEAMARLSEKSLLRISNELSENYGEISIATGENHGVFKASLNRVHKEENYYIDIEDIDILENRLIGYDEYMKIIEQLKHVKGISVFKSGESYQGRDIYTIRLLPKFKGYVSRNKLINENPTELINSRHHANEVSSTNAAFMVLKRLLTDKKYEGIGSRINLLITPMENVDGAAIHYELQKEHPRWTFHIARYNSLGKEFYRDYYDVDTIHKEAYAIRNLYYRWLPDIFVDNHGVPSHEWEQQFSGYTSPWFKGFWLPRALLYGYYWYNTDECYSSNKKLNKQYSDVVADSVIDDEEIQRWNADWRNRHEKYAHRWMPKLFPADYYKNMINYWVPSSYNSKHGYMAIRFPWITAVSFTSEVADETAQGEYLHLCARTHMLHTLAGIDMLLKSTSIYENSALKHIRQRPPILKQDKV